MDGKTFISNLASVFKITPTDYDLLQQHRIAVVIPAYNEERFIGSVVLKVLQFPLTVIVVDDGSTDATSLVAEAAGAIVIHHHMNKGYGQAIITGLTHAKSLEPEAVVIIDADGQHLVRYLPNLVKPILTGQADIVVGSRYLQQLSEVPAHRRLGHWFFNLATALTSRVKLTDSQSGYRVLSSKALNIIEFSSTGMTFASEIQFQAGEHNLKILEVPITITYSDPPKRSVIAHGMSVLGGVIKLTGQYRPLFYFSLPGMVLMLLAFFVGVVVVERYRIYQQLAVGYAMVSVLLTIIGMVSFSTGVILHSIRGLLTDLLHRNGHIAH